MQKRIVIALAFAMLTALSAVTTRAVAGCGKSRKVACPAQCNDDEVADQTQKCIFDKELYKKDGKGCIRYEPECWCKVPCPTLPENTKL